MLDKVKKTGDEMRASAVQRQKRHIQKMKEDGFERLTTWVPGDMLKTVRNAMRLLPADEKPLKSQVRRAKQIAKEAGMDGIPDTCQTSKIACVMFITVYSHMHSVKAPKILTPIEEEI